MSIYLDLSFQITTMVFHETEELVQVAAQSPLSQVPYDGFPFHHTDIKKNPKNVCSKGQDTIKEFLLHPHEHF